MNAFEDIPNGLCRKALIAAPDISYRHALADGTGRKAKRPVEALR